MHQYIISIISRNVGTVGIKFFTLRCTYLTAAVLDPRFKLRCLDSEKKTQLEAAIISRISTNVSVAAKVMSPLRKALSLDDDFFSFMSRESLP